MMIEVLGTWLEGTRYYQVKGVKFLNQFHLEEEKKLKSCSRSNKEINTELIITV